MIQLAILSEGRAEDILRKYEKEGITKAVVDAFVQAQNDIDPSINNKYLEWMVQQYLIDNNTGAIVDAVRKWHKNINKIDSTLISNRFPDWTRNKELTLIAKNPKDINSYKTFNYLQTIANDAEKRLSKNEEEKIIKAETRLVYEDSHFQIRVPLSYQASCKYGAGTAWCTRLPDTDNYFKSYSEKSILFYVIDKKMPSNPEHPMFKVAVQMNKENGSVNIWNSRDENIGDNMDYFFPPEMVEAMNAYRKKYVVDYNEIYTEIKRIMSNVSIDIGDWSTVGDGEFILSNGIYYVIPIFELKNEIVKFQLIKDTTVISTNQISLTPLIIKEIEDIAIEHDYNKDLMYQWVDKVFTYIKTNWDRVMKKFNKLIDYDQIHDMIEEKINDYSGSWNFMTIKSPTETNYMSEFASTQIIDKYTYTLTIVIDFNKSLFTLRAEEKTSDTDEQGYSDQVMSFDPETLNEPLVFIKHFTNWEKFIITLILPEEMEYDAATANLTLKDLAGEYKSPIYGKFTVEIINDEELHLKSDRMKTHNVMTTVDQFRYVMYNLQLTKVK